MKKIITILLSVLCLFSVIGINVSAEDETINLTKIEIELPSLSAGTSVIDIENEIKLTEGVKIYDGYSFINLNTNVTENTILKYDTEYKLIVRIRANEGYKIDDAASVYINGIPSECVAAYSYRNDYAITFKTGINPSKSVDLLYSVEEEYQWRITNNIPTDVTGKEIWVEKYVEGEENKNTEINVEVTKLNLSVGEKLYITVDSKNADENSYKLVAGANREAPYQITGTTASADEVWKDDNQTVVLESGDYLDGSSSVKTTGIFSWLDSNYEPTTKAPIRAGYYQDTLTFTAEIKKEIPKNGQKIFFDANGDGIDEPFIVIYTEGNDALVLSYNRYGDAVGCNEPTKGKEKVYDEMTVMEYFDAFIDLHMQDYYDNYLSNNIKKYIKEKDIEADVYLSTWNDPEISDEEYSIALRFAEYGSSTYEKVDFENKNVQKRYVYALSIEDVFKSLGKKDITHKEFNTVFGNQFGNLPNNMFFRTVKAPSGSTMSNSYYVTNGYNGYIDSVESYLAAVSFDCQIHPAFVIDLKQIEYVLN